MESGKLNDVNEGLYSKRTSFELRFPRRRDDDLSILSKMRNAEDVWPEFD